MYCSACGHQNESTAKFCVNCGKPLNVGTQQAATSPPAPPPQQGVEPGRGGLIFTLGLLSILLLGPILGIPAWVMGHKDMKKIRAGLIAASQKGLTQTGMILGIIGTFVSVFAIIVIGIAIAVGLSLFSAQSVQSNRDAMINDMNNIAAQAYQYRIRPSSMGGGQNSYFGFELPSKMRRNENAAYEAEVVTSNRIKLTATSIQNDANRITVFLDSDGKLYDWSYTGDFQ